MTTREDNLRKLDIAIQALNALARNSNYATQCKAMFFGAVQSLENMKEYESIDSAEIDTSIATNLSGALVAALIDHQGKYAYLADLRVVSTDPNNEFYNQPFYPATWTELIEAIKIDTPETDEKYIRVVVLLTGRKILDGTLPFEPKKLTFLFPDLKEHIDVVQLMREKKPAKMPSVVPNYLISIEELKAKITEEFTPYTNRRDIHFFGYGPHHIKRAKNVLAAVNAANDIELILEILQQQQELMQNQASLSTQVTRFKDKAGLDARWTDSHNLKNKPKSVNRSSYYDILDRSVKLIQSKQKSQPDLYAELLSPNRRP
jgi:hypothetical protein